MSMGVMESETGSLNDAANTIVTHSSPVSSIAASRTSAESDDTFSPVASVLSTINSKLVESLDIRARREQSQVLRGPGVDQELRCTIEQPPNSGSYNLVHTLKFSDGAKWILCIPCLGANGSFMPERSRMLRSEAMTMSFIRRNTSMPVPEIYDYCETSSNKIEVLYLLMEFAEGFSVFEKWFDDTGPTPKEERQMRILDTTAAAMSQLRKFEFDKIGSLQFEPGNMDATGIE
ncbi:hypothetical protein FPQ18DRAFT_419358 [Pyronema domesticum]|nr:hypothetical protein FPQ18DRAFT_419358 [Pyronema domesticum]